VPRVVFDTVVFVRSLINPRSFWGRLVFDHADEYQLVLSRPVVIEILEVLRRPELTRLFKALPGRDPARILELLERAYHVDVAVMPSVSRDPDDDKFLATAREGQAAYIVTGDRDLLDLGAYEGIQIVDARTFLDVLEEKRGDTRL